MDALTTSMTWALHLDSSCSPRKARSKSSLYSSSDFWLSSPEPVTTWRTSHHIRARLRNLLQRLHWAQQQSHLSLSNSIWNEFLVTLRSSKNWAVHVLSLRKRGITRQGSFYPSSPFISYRKMSLTCHLRANNWLFSFHFPIPFRWSNTTEILESPSLI